MEELVGLALMTGASVSAGYAVRVRRLVLVALGAAFAGAFMVLADTDADVRWGLVALALNVVAGAFVLGYLRGAGAAAAHQ